MAAVFNFSFGFEHLVEVGDGQKEVDVTATSGGFAIASTHDGHTDDDIYNSDAVPIGVTSGTSTGVDGAISQLSNGNLVTVTEQGGTLLFDINSSTGTNVSSGDFGLTTARDADVGSIRGGLVIGPRNFVTSFTKDYSSGSDQDVLFQIRKADGTFVKQVSVDASNAVDDTDSRLAMMSGGFVSGPSGGTFETGGFAVMFDRFAPATGGGIGGTETLMFAVYDAAGNVRKGPTALAAGTQGDIVANGNGFAVTWIDSQGDLYMRKMDRLGNTVGAEATRVYDAAPGVRIFSPTLSVLSNGYFGIAFNTNTGATVENPGTIGKTLAMVIDSPIGLVTAYASDYLLGGDLRNMDSAATGIGDWVIAGQNTGGTDATGMVVGGRRSATGDAANDTITGDDFVDNFNGGGGNDTLSGMRNSDGLVGGAGNDTLLGGEGNDFLDGGADKDMLDGGLGADDMRGGSGDDTYIVDNAADTITETSGNGFDIIKTSISYVLAAGISAEELRTTDDAGTAAIDLTGNSAANRIAGNAGNNVLDGGSGGSDTFAGYGGNDKYYLNSAGDIVYESTGKGFDIVYSSADWTLGAGSEVEEIRTTNDAGTAGIDLTGNDLANRIAGNAGVNILTGKGGNDTIASYGGADRLIGGLGADTLYGGAGGDTFVFASAAESGITATTRDRIMDFSTGDKIDVSAIDANGPASGNQAFALDTNGNFAVHEIRQTVTDGNLLLEFNTDADSDAEFSILLANHGLVGSGDFVL